MLENAAIVRRGYDALKTGDLAALAALFAENAAWHTPGKGPLSGDAVGREAVLARFGRSTAETAGTFEARLKRVLTDEDGRVIGIHHSVATRCGKQLDVYSCTVFEVENGQIVDARELVQDLSAWDEFWS
jgi:ketosteroid isomerase-like protein